MRLSASQMGAFMRCPMQYKYDRIDKREGLSLSATEFGTCVHHALHAFEREIANSRASGVPAREAVDAALKTALSTFDYYWHPLHLEEIGCRQIDVWIRGDSYGLLRQKGLSTIEQYAELYRADQHHLLSLEHPFEVTLHGTVDRVTGEPHTISGFVDRLLIRWERGKPILDTDDWKTGVRKAWLRHHLGLTVYCYASTQREFWTPFGEQADELHERFAAYPRRAWWYDLKKFERVNAGFRSDQDYKRLAYAAQSIADSIQAGIFPLRIDGDTCQWCPHRDHCPDGIGVPADDHGAPS